MHNGAAGDHLSLSCLDLTPFGSSLTSAPFLGDTNSKKRNIGALNIQKMLPQGLVEWAPLEKLTPFVSSILSYFQQEPSKCIVYLSITVEM